MLGLINVSFDFLLTSYFAAGQAQDTAFVAVERPRVISKNTDAAYVEDPLFAQIKDELQTRGFSATNEWGHISMGFVQVSQPAEPENAVVCDLPTDGAGSLPSGGQHIFAGLRLRSGTRLVDLGTLACAPAPSLIRFAWIQPMQAPRQVVTVPRLQHAAGTGS